jgi:hypothetical protein
MHPVREECADPGGVLIIEVLQQLLRSDAKICRELLQLRARTESVAVVFGELLRDRGLRPAVIRWGSTGVVLASASSARARSVVPP